MKTAKFKENLQKRSRRASIFGAVCVLVVFSFVPMIKARALENPDDYAEVRMRGATGIAVDGTNITVGYDGGEVSVTGASDPAYEIQDWNYGNDQIGDMHTLYTKSSSLTFSVHPSEGKQAGA